MNDNDRNAALANTFVSTEGEIAKLRAELDVFISARDTAENVTGFGYSDVTGRLAYHMMNWFGTLIARIERRDARDRDLRKRIERISAELGDGTTTAADASEALRAIAHEL